MPERLRKPSSAPCLSDNIFGLPDNKNKPCENIFAGLVSYLAVMNRQFFFRFVPMFFRWAGWIGCLAWCAGCGRDAAADSIPVLRVDPAALSFGYDEVGVVRTVAVQTDAAAFVTRVTYYGEEREWLDVVRDPESVGIAVRTVNRSDTPRHAAVTVMADRAEPQTVSITQRADNDQTDYGIVLEPASLRLAASGEEATGVVRIETEGDGLEAVSEASWCRVRLDAGLLQVSAAENEDGQARSCRIGVSNAQGGEAELAVWQAGADDCSVVLEPERLEFDAAGEQLTQTVTVRSAEGGLTARTGQVWITLYLSGDRLSVTVAENGGAERVGQVTVGNSGGGSASLEVVQHAGAFRCDPTVVRLGAEEPLSAVCTVSGNREGLTARPDEGCAAWLAAEVDGACVTVSALPNTAFTSRTGTVWLSNALGASAALTVGQEGRTEIDLCGVWNWISQVAGGDGSERTASGTATLAADGGEAYRLTGMAGAGIDVLGIPDPAIRLERREGRLGVVCSDAFVQGAEPYYFSGGIVFPDWELTVWHGEEAFLEVVPTRVERDGVTYDRLEFAGTVTAGADNFPDRAEIWGQTGRVHYLYYRLVVFGGLQQAVPVETHRGIVLERPAR